MPKFLDDRRLTLTLALYAFSVALWPAAAGLETTADDGYYYLEIARNLARGDGATFDRLHPTNGYHPLWLLLLVPLARLTPDSANLLLLANLLQGALAAGAAALVYRTARLALGRLGATLAALLWIDLTYRWWLSGLEPAVHAVCLLATIHVYLARHAGPRRAGGERATTLADHVALGLCCALTFLARIDTLMLAPLLALALWRQGSGRRRLAAFAAPVVGVAGAYAAVNLSAFGHLVPVSGAVKRGWSEVLLSADPVYTSHGLLAAKALNLAQPFRELATSGDHRPLALAMAGALLWAFGLLAMRSPVPRVGFFQPRRIAPWAAFCLLQLLLYGLYYHGSMSYRPWYYLCQPWLGAVLAATAIEWLRHWSRRPGPRRAVTLGTVVLCCLLAAHTIRGLAIRQHRQRPPAFRGAAAWAASHLPPDAVVGTWNAGTLGYWSGRRVVNLDGLVNSWDYFEHRRHDLCRYWRETGITHVIDAYRDGEFLTLMPTYPSYQGCADRLELIMEEVQDGGSWSIRAYRLSSPGGF